MLLGGGRAVGHNVHIVRAHQNFMICGFFFFLNWIEKSNFGEGVANCVCEDLRSIAFLLKYNFWFVIKNNWFAFIFILIAYLLPFFFWSMCILYFYLSCLFYFVTITLFIAETNVWSRALCSWQCIHNSHVLFYAVCHVCLCVCMLPHTHTQALCVIHTACVETCLRLA